MVEGPPLRAMALSRQRAAVVSMALRENALPLGLEIDIMAFDVSRPAVPPRPGVAEAQNRRVELVNYGSTVPSYRL